MFHVGLDIHSKHISIYALGETGQVARRCRVRGIEEMLRILKALPDRFEVCDETSCGYGHYHDLLAPIPVRVLVAHPGQLRLIFRSKNKNNRNDAERLAGAAALADGPRIFRAGPARRPAAEEDRAGGHRSLPGACHVGAAEAGHPLGGEDGPSRLTHTREGFEVCVF
jgi:hypothetical protein